MWQLLIASTIFLDTLIVKDTLIAFDEPVKFSAPFLFVREKIIEFQSANRLIYFLPSILVKDYGNLSSISFRGNRTQDINISFNGIPLKGSNNFADLSLLPNLCTYNILLISGNFTNLMPSQGGIGGLELKPEFKNASFEFISKNQFLIGFPLQKHLYIEVALNKDTLRGYAKANLVAKMKGLNLLMTVRKAKIPPPLGSNFKAEKTELFIGYFYKMFSEDRLTARIKGNYSIFAYQGYERDLYNNGINSLELGLRNLKINFTQEFILSEKTHNRLRNFLSINYKLQKSIQSWLVETHIGGLIMPQTYPSGFIGISYTLTRSLLSYIHFSKGYTLPSLFDLYWDPSDPFAEGNPLLKPETHFQLETGFRYLHPFLGFITLSFYRRSITDMILWYPHQNGKYKPENIGHKEIMGLEMFATGRCKKLIWYLNFSKAWFRNLIYFPDITFSFGTRIKFFEFNGVYIGKRQMRPSSPKMFPSILLANAQVFIRISSQFRIIGGFENLFNIKYQWVKGYPADGRIFFIKMEVSL